MHVSCFAVRMLALIFLVGGCASFKPVPFDEVGFIERGETVGDASATVTFVVLSPEESRRAFGTNLAKHDIQPIWFAIENHRDERSLFLPITVDPDYFSPREAAHKARFFMSSGANTEMEEFFAKHAMGLEIPPHEVRSGFVFSNLDHGAKMVRIELVGTDYHAYFEQLVTIPGLQADYMKVDWDGLYPQRDYVMVDKPNLRKLLEELPPTATGKDGKWAADPLNLVVIGDGADLSHAFISRDWDLTEVIAAGSVMRTVASSLFKANYRYSPVSPLYVFGRQQDIAFQKARGTVDERNHLRLWLTPIMYEGMHVFVGQISRDIGVRVAFETFPPVTHIIDPEVDEARTYLVQDLAQSQRLKAVGYVSGVGAAPRDEPRGNLTGDPYFTDGLRIVMIVTDEETHVSTIQRLNWEPTPP